ncbi:MAG: YeeE/YedE family protein [Bacteroidia bacterium]|nr:YeeE/YedE family protein [Bacteroidia bacterium]MBT8269571.1 YeeE/YedE family protein [Bacteroidia bacterium]NNF82735.1 YeeE/YedE family protein [Flavobacteriaceae bacterium]NNK69080.1 YeeE/YedE family protein [Flavobacteriaceae bacterium]NNL80949.1 YeeE/YedE family protein [Flavobacteriaceae bacterium]
MKTIKYLIVGIIFGIILTKAEVISWFRIYEMFKFQSFHMYGIIGSAVVLGVIMFFFFKKGTIKDYKGKLIELEPKKKGFARTLIGGTIFGLGWGLIGACPGPMFILLGRGAWSIIVVIIGGLLGAMLYHAIKQKLPH